MKKLIILILLVFHAIAINAQERSVRVNVVKYDPITTTVRNTYVVPASQIWKIYNSTTNQWEENNGGAGWVASAAGGGSADNLGNHTATTDLNMDGNNITGAANILDLTTNQTVTGKQLTMAGGALVVKNSAGGTNFIASNMGNENNYSINPSNGNALQYNFLTQEWTLGNDRITTTADGGGGDFLANGTIPMTGNFDAGGNNLTNIGTVSATSFFGIMRFSQISTPPGVSGNGYAYYNDASDHLALHDGSTWRDLAFADEVSAGAVSSVNGQTGAVTFDTDDISQGSTNLYATSAEKAKIANAIEGTISGRTGTQVTNILSQTEAQLASDGAANTGEIIFCSDCAPMALQTASTFDLDDFRGIDDRVNDTATFTFSNVKTGSSVLIEANRATDATYSGITIAHTKGSFSANTRQLITIFILPSGEALFDYKDLE